MFTRIPNDFKKRLLIFMIPVLILCFVFIILVHFGGPRIRSVAVNESQVNQQIVLTFNSEITAAENITLSPETDFEYTLNNFQMFISVKTPLLYRTEYRIDMKLIDTRGVSSTQSANFNTENPDIYFLNRSENSVDVIQKTKIDTDEIETIYEAESILLYDFSPKSMLVVEEIEKEQFVYIVIDNRITLVRLPANTVFEKLSGSSTQDKYLFTLSDKTNYEKSIWVYDVDTDNLEQLDNDEAEPIIGSNAQFAPDGRSIFYFDTSRSLILLSEDSTQVPINLGSFDSVDRILPNEKGVFGFRNNNYATIISSDGSEKIAPKNVQNNSLVKQFNSLSDYIFVKQAPDIDGIHLEQNLISYIDKKEIVIKTNRVKEDLIFSASLSPNDEFVVVEEATQPVIFDGFYPNIKPKDGYTSIVETRSGSIIKNLAGYDIKWKL